MQYSSEISSFAAIGDISVAPIVVVANSCMVVNISTIRAKYRASSV